MKKILALIVVMTMILSMFSSNANAAVPVGDTNIMYATGEKVGDEVDVSLPDANIARLNSANALGVFDALQSDGNSANEKFYALASHEWTEYTFADNFINVDGKPDISFCEVTWGTTWHTEATLVYLTEAYVRDEEGNVELYTANDKGYGYYAGIAWNKVGINGLSSSERNTIAENYLPDGISRTFVANTFSQSGNFGLSQFNLPEEVVYATGVTLVDITKDVYNMYGNASTYTDNTDGYDLDAIRVYKYIPWRFNDSATGCNKTGFGDRILPKGTWFMYNKFDITLDDPTYTFPIQAGNPLDGVNIIGTLTVVNTGEGKYKIEYYINNNININGYNYEITKLDEHLSISDSLSFTANPGKDDNQDFGKEFDDQDGIFFIFAHIVVGYK